MTKRDIDRVRVEMDRLRERLDVIQMMHSKGQGGWSAAVYLTSGPETAAIRRASMDLTRALADLRRPNP